ncbi:transmembrane amino acid transporter protein-domain-containing protein [Dendryphion nanum]|uniref:Transmembrane amino acid transporter protein-domain-containing protein n=1 Tax=Dendryphion nanum TaxID=256645 RepID=A0A9P9EJF1_9PLEO|nr:transmembrane amino acid transporter protein-domain-containing protein [Dendryphion nanum]
MASDRREEQTMAREQPIVRDSERDFIAKDAEKHQKQVFTQDGSHRNKWANKEDPFGDEEGAEVKYRTLTWWQAALIMIAETISLGILSLPSTLNAIGIVPGMILIVGLGIIATYTGYVLSQFKLAYPHVHNLADAGEILAGPIGREFGGAIQTIFLIFVMGSHILTFTIAMNAITGHAACTIVWGVVGFIVLWLFTLPRTLKKMSYLSIASFISICGAVLITMIGVGVNPLPNILLNPTVNTSLAPAFLSVANIVFAYAGHIAFFTFISELRDPKEFPKALYLLQITDISMYIIVAVVIYRFTGGSVTSPALGSASNTVMRIAYGIALPTILLAGVIYGHVASKYVYVRLFRGTEHMSKRTWLSIGSWALITFVFWLLAWIIAQSIPNFNSLLALISSLFASWFTYGMSGILWLFLNWNNYGKNWKKICLTVLNLFIIVIGAAVCGIGLYASGKAIRGQASGSSWSCADNSR